MRLDADQIAALKARLARLNVEHRKLDAQIRRDAEGPYVDEVSVRRKKRRKLILKDQITRLENLLIPDQPA